MDAIQTIEALVKLHDKNAAVIKDTGRAAITIEKVFYYLERSPIIDIKKTSVELNLSYNTIANAVNKLVELGILKQTENVRRSRVFAYPQCALPV
jgi:hypothetical protein